MIRSQSRNLFLSWISLVPNILHQVIQVHGFLVGKPVSQHLGLGAEFGELSVSELPSLDSKLLEQAHVLLPWERNPQDNIQDQSQKDLLETWWKTREKLTTLWVLPRDMSNGSWEAYSRAASKGELKLLQQVPQLLRLDSNKVVASAKMVLNNLGLPPAVLRTEPLLLTMDLDQLMGGFERLQATADRSADQAEAVNVTRDLCRDHPERLVEAAAGWAQDQLSC